MSNLLNQLQVPSRFEQTDNVFWQDPYIAKIIRSSFKL